jgi:uncharacterized membrane protein YbhN (UPF0104 family)
MKRYFKLSLKIAVSLLLLIYLVNTIDFSKSLDLVLSSNTFYFSLSILLIILNYVFSSLRWKYLILSEKKINPQVLPQYPDLSPGDLNKIKIGVNK